MRRARPVQWEIALLAHGVVLGIWLRAETFEWAVAALATGVLAFAVGVGRRRAAPLLVAVLALAGGLGALGTARRVAEVETNWERDSTGVRWRLVADAGARLDHTLGDAVGTAEALADAGLAVTAADRDAAAARLADIVSAEGPEAGVLVLDANWRPWAWAGRHRLTPAAPGPLLDARITPFYATLDAWRQAPNGFTVVGHVLLDADLSVPDRDRTVRARFAAATGVDLEFFQPGRGPNWTDVFDYCLPSCTGAAVVPDTLFSVRLAPPSQGAHKLDLLAHGGRRGALLMVAAVAGVMLLGRVGARLAALAVLGGLFVLTPAGPRSPLGGLFSAGIFYADALGPFSSSAGALLVAAALALGVAVFLTRRRGRRPRPYGWLVAAALVGTAPYLLRVLAAGITPPSQGAHLSLWLAWELPIAVGGAGMLVLAGSFLRTSSDAPAPRWMSLVAMTWAGVAAAVGLLIWQPPAGWPPWYLYLWVPAIVLAIQPGARLRAVVTSAVVAGTAAALLTWGAVAEGRLLLAERDIGGLRQGGDPVAVGLLEHLGARLVEEDVPRDAAALFARWSRSALHEEGYPAVLITWTRTGAALARLDLAQLDVESSLLQRLALQASDARVQSVTQVERVPGTHYILSVPFGDGSVVTVTLGPRSRAVPPVRIATFLRGDQMALPPYELNVSEPGAGGPPPGGRVTWRRDGRRIRGEALLELPDGARHLHATIDLGAVSGLLVRGGLLVVLDVVLIGLLWVCVEALFGGTPVPPVLVDLALRRSYRARLGVAFAVFFVVPTVGFAAWTAQRLRIEAQRARDLVIRQTLADAAGTVAAFPGMPEEVQRAFLVDLSGRVKADLVFYEGGALERSSAPVLMELGVLDRYLPPSVHAALVGDDALEVEVNERIAGRATRVGYRDLGAFGGRGAVLASPRLVEDPALLRSERDLLFGLLLATLLGLGTAAGLATLAAGALARPVHALRDAAEDVGRGSVPTPFGADAPSEFGPVMDAFDRMARDVATGRRAVEEHRERTVAVLRNVATGVVALDDRLLVTAANPRAQELTGRPLPTGRAVHDTAAPEWLPVWDWVRAVANGARDSDPREFVVRERQIRVQVGRLRGAASGWVVAFDDVTDLARAVRVLAWGELARQVAHEIKNPLTPIRLGIQHLRRSFDAPRGDFSETLERTSQQMLAEIERLDAIARAFSRFGAPPAEAEPLARVGLGEVARDTAALYTIGGEFDVRVDAGRALQGVARRDELKEVLINLIENARAAGARATTITARAAEGGALIEVRDDGRGIPPDDLPRVFEPRFSTTTSGTGLGLAICKRLVESWGAAIAVESEVGRGTTVRLRIAAPGSLRD